MRPRIIALFVASIVLAWPAVCRGGNGEYLDTFEIVWDRVNETYFDTTFGGLSWSETRDRYRPRVAAAESDEEFYELVNDMLWELNVSHANLVPSRSFARYEPLALAEGSTGIDVRMVDGAAVITSVADGSPAHEAGLRTGYAIESVDGIPVERIARETKSRIPPPVNSRNRRSRIAKAILSRVYGAPGTEVAIVYTDGQGERRERNIARVKRNGARVGQLFLAVEFEARILGEGIGYIRINSFLPPLVSHISRAIESMGDIRGIIFDLRGNSGGEIEGMPGLFLRDKASLYVRKSRSGETEVIFEPADNAFRGPLILLIDETSGSASELFAAGMQAIGRAVVVGTRSPGIITESDTEMFPNGAIFIYPVAQLFTPDGALLEGHGVVPDIEVDYDREMLLRGIDPQLDAAAGYMERVSRE